MSETTKLRMDVFKHTIILTCLIAGFSAVFIDNFVPFIYGLVFGTLIAILNFNLLAKTIERAARMTPEKAKAYATARYFIRYTVYGIVIFISIKADYINVIGTVAGLLAIKAVIIIRYAFNDKTYYKKIFRKK